MYELIKSHVIFLAETTFQDLNFHVCKKYKILVIMICSNEERTCNRKRWEQQFECQGFK